MSAPPAPRAMYLDGSREGIFAIFHDAAPRSGCAVLMCAPFGWDDMCSYRSRRDWAQALAREGHPTLRFDLPGSGDSAAAPSDPGRPGAWRRAISEAAEWLRANTHKRRIVAVGIGLGGLLAYLAASDGAPIDDLVLWSVPSRGRLMMRELRAFSRLETAGSERTEAPTRSLPEGALAANGYLLSAETVSALEAVDLAEAPLPDAGARRVLLLGRRGTDVDQPLLEALKSSGADVSTASGDGYEAMMLEPQDARTPTDVFDTVGAWLADVAATPSDLATPPGPSDFAAEKLALRVGEAELRESPLWVEHDGLRLLGVLSQPRAPHVDLCAVLLNAGPQRRIGPNRMWVEIARRWAARGVPSLRLDLAAIGDSDGDAGLLRNPAALYLPDYLRQVQDVLDKLEAEGMPRRFLLLGLCSGAYWSLQAALADERVSAVHMLNPRVLVWDEWTHGRRRAQALRERVFLSSTWHKAVRGEITLSKHLLTARALARGALQRPLGRGRATLGRVGDSAWIGSPSSGPLETLREREQHALLMFTGREPLHAELIADGMIERLDAHANIQLAIHGTSADTHTLAPIWLQREVHELLDDALEAELKRV